MTKKITTIPRDKQADVLRDYKLKNARKKYVHSVKSIAEAAGVTPGEVVAFAVARGAEKRVFVHSDSVVKAALSDYVNHPDTFTGDIAEKYGVSPATLSVWAENAGITLRSRGLHKLDEPTVRQKEILEKAALYPYEDVGEMYGISRARVGAIVKRWKNWKVVAEPPFKPGDIVEWKHKGKKEKLTVVEAGLTHGTMRDSKGQTLRSFSWNTGGRLPKKVGVDEKYVVNGTSNGNGHGANGNGATH